MRINKVLEGTTNLISGIASTNARCTKSGNGVFVDWTSATGDTYFFFSMRSTPQTNTTYTLSFRVSGLNGTTGIKWAWSNLAASQYNVEIRDGLNSITFTLDGSEMRCFFDDKANKTGVAYYMYDFQLEAKDHATPYVNGTRANNTIIPVKPKLKLEGTTNLFPSQYQNAKFITGASGNTLANAAGSFSISCTTHGTYTLSGYYKLATTDTATNPRVTLCAKYSGDTNATQIVRLNGNQLKDGEWHYFAITGTTNTNETLTNLSGWIFDYSSAGNARNIECKCIQLEMKDHATYYTPTSRASGTSLKVRPLYLIAEGTTNLGMTSMNYSNKTNGQTQSLSGWGGDAGTVTFYHSGGYNNYPYKVYHKTATGTGGVYFKTANDITIEAGKTYTMSIYIKASVNVNNASAYGFNINRGSDNNYINYGSSFNITTDWKRLVKTFTATSSQAGSYGEMSIIYDDTVTDYYIYYSGFQIEEKDHATPYVNGTRADNTII